MHVFSSHLCLKPLLGFLLLTKALVFEVSLDFTIKVSLQGQLPRALSRRVIEVVIIIHGVGESLIHPFSNWQGARPRRLELFFIAAHFNIDFFCLFIFHWLGRVT